MVTKAKLITPKEAALYLGLAPETLTTWRSTRRYPLPFVKVGRYVRYDLADLDRFLESRKVNP